MSTIPPSATYPFETLPDYLAPGMRLLLVGINPSAYSVRQGHYFTRRTSRGPSPATARYGDGPPNMSSAAQ